MMVKLKDQKLRKCVSKENAEEERKYHSEVSENVPCSAQELIREPCGKRLWHQLKELSHEGLWYVGTSCADQGTKYKPELEKGHWPSSVWKMIQFWDQLGPITCNNK